VCELTAIGLLRKQAQVVNTLASVQPAPLFSVGQCMSYGGWFVQAMLPLHAVAPTAALSHYR
jgi:hypothetical protein